MGTDNDGHSIYAVATLSSTGWSWSRSVEIDPDGPDLTLQALACPTTKECIAVGFGARRQAITLWGRVVHGSWVWSDEVTIVRDINGWGVHSGLASVSCPSSTECVAVGQDLALQGIETVGTLSDGSWSWTPTLVVPSDDYGWSGLFAVRCPSATECLATGADADNEAVWSVGTRSSTSWAWTTTRFVPDSEVSGELYGISCPSTLECITVGTDDVAGIASIGHETDGSWSWSPLREVDRGQTGVIISVDCVSDASCVGVGVDSDDGQGVSVTVAESAGKWTWSKSTLIPAGAGGDSNALSVGCSAANDCVEVGASAAGQAASATGIAAHGVWKWSKSVELVADDDDAGAFNDVVCSSATRCLAVGGDGNDEGIAAAGADVGGSWHWGALEDLGYDSDHLGSVLISLSCPTAVTCVAIGFDEANNALYATASFSSGAWHWSRLTAISNSDASVDGPIQLSGVSCPTSTRCLAVGSGVGELGVQIAYAEGTRSGTHWRWDVFSAGNTEDQEPDGVLATVSCPSPTECVAVGNNPDGGPGGVYDAGLYGIANFVSGQWTWSTPVNLLAGQPQLSDLYGVSCPTTSTCVAVGHGGALDNQEDYLVLNRSGSTWSWTQEGTVAPDATEGGTLIGVDCDSSMACVSVGWDKDQQAIVTTATATAGTWQWSSSLPVPRNGSGGGILDAVSCPTTTDCVAAGTDRSGLPDLDTL